MQLKRKHYPIACVFCFILIIALSATHAYKPDKPDKPDKPSTHKAKSKEGFSNNIINRKRRQLLVAGREGLKLAKEGYHAIQRVRRA